MSDTTAAYVAAYRAAYAAAAREICTLTAEAPDAAEVEEIASAWRSPRDAAGDAVNDLIRLIVDPREERDTIEWRAVAAAIAAARAA
jgi:hypothetical protein